MNRVSRCFLRRPRGNLISTLAKLWGRDRKGSAHTNSLATEWLLIFSKDLSSTKTWKLATLQNEIPMDSWLFTTKWRFWNCIVHVFPRKHKAWLKCWAPGSLPLGSIQMGSLQGLHHAVCSQLPAALCTNAQSSALAGISPISRWDLPNGYGVVSLLGFFKIFTAWISFLF